MVIILSLALYWAFAPAVVTATVQVLPETTLLVEGKKVAGQSRLLGHPVVKGLLTSFERAEAALKK